MEEEICWFDPLNLSRQFPLIVQKKTSSLGIESNGPSKLFLRYLRVIEKCSDGLANTPGYIPRSSDDCWNWLKAAR